MGRMFTAAELEELRRADAEIDEAYSITNEEMAFSRRMDQAARLSRLDNRERKIAAQKAAYREANREKIAAQKAAYREANREKIAAQKAAWQKKNREKWNAYQREYRRKRLEEKKNTASSGANTGSGNDKTSQC